MALKKWTIFLAGASTLVLIVAMQLRPISAQANRFPTALPALKVVQTQPPTTDLKSTFDEILSLATTYQASLGQGPGWIHRVTRHTSDPSVDFGTLPTGMKIPNDYIMEDWYYLGDKGLVLKAYSRMVDKSGAVVQESRYSQGQTTNLTLDQVFTTTPYPLDFSNGIANSLASPATTAKRSTDDTGKIVFEIANPMDSPVQMSGATQAVNANMTRSGFDPITGEMVWSETLFILADGSELLHDRMDVITTERVTSPPDDILKVIGE